MNRCAQCAILSESRPDTCPGCGAYATLIPLDEPPPPDELGASRALEASTMPEGSARQWPTGFEAWDEALAGGVAPGSTIVLYGDPGSRKTTWAGAIADAVATGRRGTALYLSAEQPSDQVRDAVVRVRTPQNLFIIGSDRDAANLDAADREIALLRPKVVVFDSIQTFDVAGGFAGSDWAVTSMVSRARRGAALRGHVAILISQCNKAGEPAGPFRTIYTCDVVLRVEPNKVSAKKNRFGQLRAAVLP